MKILGIMYFLCFIMTTQAEVRYWTGGGDGHNWLDGNNWSPITCLTYNNTSITGYYPPREGEIVIFDNVGTISIDGISSLYLGEVQYEDYSDVVGGCNFPGSYLHAMHLFNSHLTFNFGLSVGGNAMPIPGFAEAFRMENSTLQCNTFEGGAYLGFNPPQLNMNTCFVVNSTITSLGFGVFSVIGNSYFNNCIVNCPGTINYKSSNPLNNPNVFISCTFNTTYVLFQNSNNSVISAEFNNCTFNFSGASGCNFNLGSSLTVFHSVVFDNIQINVGSDVEVFYFEFNHGGYLLNGNIFCASTSPDFRLYFNHYGNYVSNTLKIDGNITLSAGSLRLYQMQLDLTGDLNLIGLPSPTYFTHSVVINSTTQFQIGGNMAYNSFPLPSSHFVLKFSGSGDSHVSWPIGFPVDTLLIEKTECGKVHFDNCPLYVTGKLKVNSGQLVLAKHTGINYSLVNGADLEIEQGGSIYLQDSVNIAIAGNYMDNNTSSDSANCQGLLTKPFNIVSFYDTQYTPANRVIGSANAAGIGNVSFINQNSSPFSLQNNLTVSNLDLGNYGKIILGNYNLSVNGNISNFNSNKFIVTNGPGSLVIKNIGSNNITFPVGSSITSYNPVILNNIGTTDDFRVRVQEGLLNMGTVGFLITENAVNTTWLIEESVQGGSDVSVTMQWKGADELSGFTRNNAFLAHYANNNWEQGTLGAASGSNPYQLSISNLTSFSPFTVMSQLPLPNKSLQLSSVFLQGLYLGSGMMKRVQYENGFLFPDPTQADALNIELHDNSYNPVFTLNNIPLYTIGELSTAIPGNLTGSYYITIKHRNHLETTTANPVSFSGNNISYSFDLPSKAYGNNLFEWPESNAHFVLYGGDINQDGIIDAEDMISIDNQSISASPSLANDINGDGNVNLEDMNLAEENAAEFCRSILP